MPDLGTNRFNSQSDEEPIVILLKLKKIKTLIVFGSEKNVC